MLPKLEWGDRGSCAGPLLVMCHWLGGSAASWSLVAGRLAERGFRCVALDLPGFGSAADISGYSQREMADAVIATIQALRTGNDEGTPWLLAGHSMGGAVAAIVAREAVNGAPGLQGLCGLILVSPSPPGPEPMKESKRSDLLESIGTASGDPDRDRKHADTYVKDNVGKPKLGESTLRTAANTVLQANKSAMRAWLESGSKEDWSSFVGNVPLPALIVAGTEDEALGPDVQRERTLPQFGGASAPSELVALEGTGHLAPLERPGVLADRIAEFATGICPPSQARVRRDVPLGERFGALLASDLTAPQTRAVLAERLADHEAGVEPAAIHAQSMQTLRELVRAVVPGAPFDLAARIDQALANGRGDGWRPATLPRDADAWQRGLASLEAAARHAYGVRFAELNDELQHALLSQAAEGKLGSGLGERLLHAVGLAHEPEEQMPYDAAQMKLWFEEVRGELTKLYIADPRTMERIGFTGFADEQTFTQIQLGEREAWER